MCNFSRILHALCISKVKIGTIPTLIWPWNSFYTHFMGIWSPMCVCTYASVSVCEFRHVNALVLCGGQRAALGDSLCCPLRARQGLCCFPLCAQDNWPRSCWEFFCLHLPCTSRSAGIIDMCYPAGFHWDLGIRTLVPHDYVVRVFTFWAISLAWECYVKEEVMGNGVLNDGWDPLNFIISLFYS